MDRDQYSSWYEQGSGPAGQEPAFAEYTVPLGTLAPEDLDRRAGQTDPYAQQTYQETEAEEEDWPEGVVGTSGYEIPESPASGWSAAPSKRRFWIGRGLVAVVMLIQAALSLRLHNTADVDEATTLIVGKQELNHLLHGGVAPGALVHQVSGAPALYPVLADLATSLSGGLTGARLLSLLCALAGTAVLYSLSRRLFNERVAICGAGAYAVVQSTVVLGFYASSDAMAILLLALAGWVIVYTDRSRVAMVLLAAPIAALAVGTEYASALALPALFLLAVLTRWPHRGLGGSLVRGALFAVGSGGLMVAAATATHALDGLSMSAISRHQGNATAGSIISDAAEWGGVFLGVALAGGIAYIIRERMYEVVDAEHPPSSRAQRVLLVFALLLTAAIVPVYQAQLHSSAAMYRHIGIGLLFAAPLTGLGLTRLVGAHFRQPQLGILVWVLMLALGVSQSEHRFQSWPDSSKLVSALSAHVDSTGRYLTEVDVVPQYYLDGKSSENQWTSAADGLDFKGPKGVELHGTAGLEAAINSGWFSMIVLDSSAPAAEHTALGKALDKAGKHYLLSATIPYRGSTGTQQSYEVYLAR